MTQEEIFENRREVGRKICQQIRENNYQMSNAKFFVERPYCDGAKNYKFSAANYLRLMLSNKKVIRSCDPRWILKDEIKNNGWTLKENAKSELLEVWEKSSDGKQECFLTEFYNAADIEEKENFLEKNQSLEKIVEFLKVRGLLAEFEEIISFQNCIDEIKKYAAENGADELTKILTVQMFVVESSLKIKIENFLSTYLEEILTEIEKNPDKLFYAASQAQSILKKLRYEKIKPLAIKSEVGEVFGDLKIIYHGSEGELKNKFGSAYLSETILTVGLAYEFLFMLKSAEKQKVWLEFFYKDYAHGKFLISEKDFEMLAEESVTEFLKSHLNENRQEILKNPQELKKYISPNVMIRTEELINQANVESEIFQLAMEEFEREEMRYLESHAELLQTTK